MKRFASLLLFLALVFAATPAHGQQYFPQGQGASPLHYVGGMYIAPQYATWHATIISGNTATGSGVSIIVTAPSVLADGTQLPAATVFSTSVPVSIADNNSEIFTPTAVSIAACPAGNIGVGQSQNGVGCATLTGTINNTHGASAFVVSGDNGIEEAIADAANHGGGNVYVERDCGVLVLSTSGATTTATNCGVPLNMVATGASVFVTTTITTAATYSVGFAGNTTLFLSACASLTAGLNCSAKNVAPAESATGTSFALSNLLVTANATAGAGAVHLKAWGYSQVSSNQ